MPKLLQIRDTNKRYIPKAVKHEQNLQRQICTYLRYQYPMADYKSDYASGLYLTANQAKINKSLSSTKGWPDLMIPYPMTHGDKHYCGMVLEIKTAGTTVYLKNGARKGKLTADPHIQSQAAVLQRFHHNGWYAAFGVGIDDCLKKIDFYFKKPQTKEMF